MTPEEFSSVFERMQANVELALRGKPEVVRLALLCFISEGHLLLEDVPGTGKTSLARALAASLDASCGRIQFTPDLLPSDVTGVSIYDQRRQEFEFHEGAVFNNVVIADEINRASPKTQSALLEVMEEQQVSVEGTPRPVPRPFMVVATQNPVDMDGTYALPEAQLDRFLMRLRVGYPSLEDSIDILTRQAQVSAVVLHPVTSAEEVISMAKTAEQVFVAPAIRRYIAQVIMATRDIEGVLLGASPRASLALQRVSRVRALSEGRHYVIPEDITALAPAVLAHRIILTSDAVLRKEDQETAVARALQSVAVPQNQAG